MKKLILLPILIIAFTLTAQESSDSKWSFGLNYSPNYSYRTIENNDDFSHIIDSRNENEKPAFGFNTGVSAKYFWMNRFEIEMGLQYARYSSSWEVTYLTSPQQPEIVAATTLMRFDYLEIPLRVNYKIINKKFFGYASIGISLNQFLTENSIAQVTYFDGNEEKLDISSGYKEFNQTTFSLLGGIGAGYHFGERFDIRLEPIIRYSLTPIADALINQYNYSIGGQFAVNFKL